jgi:hypothetical protein
LPLTLTQLLAPLTVDQVRTMLLGSLQGLGIVVKSGTGPGSTGVGTGSLTLSGTPSAAFTKIVINIVTAGELGAAQFQYSLDGGVTFSGTQTVPASPGTFAVPTTGVSITFVSGPVGAGTSFTLSDQFIFATQIPSLTVTSWTASSGYRQLVEVEAQALAAFSAQQTNLAAAGLTTKATGAWADLLGVQFYGLIRNGAAATAGQVTLKNAQEAGPFTITAGQMTFSSTNALLYTNTTGGTLAIALATPVNAAFSAGVGTLVNGTYYYRVTALNAAGETLASTETSLVIAAGPQGVNVNWGAVAGATGYKIYGRSIGAELFIAQVGAVTTYLDGGSITPAGALPSSNTTDTLSLQVQAVAPGAAYNVGNGTIISIVGGTLPGVTVNNPDPGTGTWVTSQGADPETDSAYMLRCQQRWPALGTGSTAAVYQLWATSAEAAAGHGTTITKTLVQPDGTTAGQVDLYLAGASGAVGAGAVTDAQTYINPRVPLTATTLIQAATNVVITLAGTVNYFAAKTTLAAVQAAVSAALTNFFLALGIGSDAGGANVKVFYAELLAVVGAASETAVGAYPAIRNVASFTVNAASADIGLTTGQVATLTNSLTLTAV